MLKVLIMLCVGLLTLLLGFYILKKNIKNANNISYFFLCIFGGLWVLAKAFQYWSLDEDLHDLLINKMAYSFGLLTPLFYVIFAYNFPYKFKIYSKRLMILIYLIPIIIVLLILFGILRFHETQIINNILYRRVIFNQYLILTIYYFTYTLGGLIILLQKYFTIASVIRQQIKYLILATISVFFVTGIVNVLLILLNNFTYDWLGPIFLLTHLIIFGYFILYRLTKDR